MHYEFDVQMNEKVLYDFLMYHNYVTTGGIVWAGIGVFALGLAIFSGSAVSLSYRIMYLLFGLLFLVYIPVDMKRKCKKQMKTNPFYKKPIHYIVDEYGITSSQEEHESKAPWTQFRKIKISKHNIIIYMQNRNACIFPKEVFADSSAKVAGDMRLAMKEGWTKTENEKAH